MLVHLERVGCAEQHHAGEHVPLDFEPAVRALAEQIAARGVAGADQRCQQNQPVCHNSQLGIEPVDPATDRKQNFSHLTPQRLRKLSRPPKIVPPDLGLRNGMQAKTATLIRCPYPASMENFVDIRRTTRAAAISPNCGQRAGRTMETRRKNPEIVISAGRASPSCANENGWIAMAQSH